MIKIPSDVELFSYGVIYDIVDSLYDEDETLDFKSDITSEPEYIAKTCCAFANTNGGIMIFGVDNDRRKKLTTEQRIKGLEDSDDLKVKIINQIKNINPNIPVGRVIFRKSNTSCPNGKVLVVLKILESNINPHQYNGLCYKRIGGRNHFMQIDEIKTRIIDSSKNASIFAFFMSECGLLRYNISKIKASVENGSVGDAIGIGRHLDTTATNHFMYHQAHLYSEEVGNGLMRLLEAINKIQILSYESRDLLKEPIENQSEAFKKKGGDDTKELILKKEGELAEFSLLILTSLEKSLNDKFPEALGMSEIKKEFSN